MGVNQSIDIAAEERRIVLALLKQHLPGTTAWVYGSRVNRTSRPQSDLDLVVFATPEQGGRVGDLREAFEESNLPFRVDLFVWDDVPEAFRKQIQLTHVVLVTGNRTRFGKGIPFGTNKWQRVALNDVVQIFDGPHATPKKTRSGPIFLGIGNLSSGRIDLAKTEHLNEEDYVHWTRRVTPRPGDIVFSYETRIGEAALIPVGLRCCLGRRMGLLRPKGEKVDPRFLLYAYLGPGFQDTLRSRTIHGSTVNRLLLTEMGKFPIEIPENIREQRRIAQVIGTLDDKIELNRRMNETLEALVQALFKSWFVDFDPVRAKMEGWDPGLPQPVADLFPDRLVDSELGGIPEGFRVVPLPEVMEINPRRHLRRGERAPYLPMADMPTKGHFPHSVANRPYGSGKRFTNGDTLVARITPCLENGKTAYVDFLQNDQIGWGSTEYIVMRPKSPLPNEFAYCLARSNGFREFAIQNMSGTSGRQRVPPKAFSALLIVVPPKSVAESFGICIQPLLARVRKAAYESRALAALRDTLLPKLISGDLRVTVPARILVETV